MPRKLYLFPGAHKTGTTYLQYCLKKLSTPLRDKGVIQLKRQRAYQSGFHRYICYGEEPNTDLEKVISHSFDEEDWRNYDIVISLENIFGEALPGFYAQAREALSRINHVFCDHECHVVLYVRRQDEFLGSLYLQSIHQGGCMDFQTYCDHFLKSPTLNWRHLADEIASTVGKERLNVRPYDLLKKNRLDYLRSFLGVFYEPGNDELLKLENKAANAFTNQSLGEKGLELAIESSRYIENVKERRQFIKTIREVITPIDKMKFKVPESVRENIAEHNKEENGKLASDWNFDTELARFYEFEDAGRM